MPDTILRIRTEKEAEFSITIKGARSKEAALSTILDMLKPEARDGIRNIAESRTGFKQDDDSYSVVGHLCCQGGKYYSCATGSNLCFYMGEGCPA